MTEQNMNEEIAKQGMLSAVSTFNFGVGMGASIFQQGMVKATTMINESDDPIRTINGILNPEGLTVLSKEQA